MSKIAIMSLGMMMLSAPTFAASKCENAQDQATMNQCADGEFSAADKKLNANYKSIQRRLADTPDAKKLLAASQRAWLKFRDAECAFSSSASDGGSIQPMLIANCKASLTSDRNKQLDNYLNCPEGDMSCPVPSGN
ncbi:lysozyme inhibitor LprI family protein [Ochrobactrum sp. CM-21-5]|nr:lysozyme inhibitor LprI family protein [Ochrobactrum sp. CM-21-5]MBC2885454.1 lysozyme inhibitor LprI family protein [Ochrobactrum sp. CM-21-5]